MHSTQTTIHIEDLRLNAYVGLHAPERDQLQVVAIDITCILTDPNVPNDDLERTVDYVPIVEQVQTLAINRKRRLIETFAEEIADVCFKNALAQSVIVSIRKPNKLPAVAAVGITRTFERRGK